MWSEGGNGGVSYFEVVTVVTFKLELLFAALFLWKVKGIEGSWLPGKGGFYCKLDWVQQGLEEDGQPGVFFSRLVVIGITGRIKKERVFFILWLLESIRSVLLSFSLIFLLLLLLSSFFILKSFQTPCPLLHNSKSTRKKRKEIKAVLYENAPALA